MMYDHQPAIGQPIEGVVCVEEYGVVPWNMDRTGAIRLLLVSARGRRGWTVPKGPLMPGLNGRETAMREAFNEGGVVGRLEPEPVGRFLYRRLDGDGAFHWHAATLFSMRVAGTLLNWPEKEDRKRAWFELNEAIAAVDDPGLRNLLVDIDFHANGSHV